MAVFQQSSGVSRSFSRRAVLALLAAVGPGCVRWKPDAPHGPDGASPAPEPVWRTEIPTQGVPAVDRTAVYAVGGHREILAVDRRTGRPRWSQPSGAGGGATQGFRLVAVGRDTLVAGDYDLFALRRSNGRPVWTFAPGDGGYGPGIYLGDCDERLAFAGSPAGRLYAVDCLSGQLVWSLPVDAEGACTVFEPVAAGQTVVAGYTTFSAPVRGGVIAADRTSGTRLWQAAFPLPTDPLLGVGWAGGPVLVGDQVVVSSGDGRIHCVDRATGRFRWSLPSLPDDLPDSAGDSRRDFRALAVSGRTLVAASLTGYVSAWDLDTLLPRWSRAPGEGSAAFRAAADQGTIYVPFQSGRAVAFDASSGTSSWRVGTPTGPRFAWPPAIASPMLYFATTEGLYAFEAPSDDGASRTTVRDRPAPEGH